MTEEVVRKWKREIYPWLELVNSGDSFLIPLDKRGTGRQLVFAANQKAGETKYRFDSSSGEVIKL
jgi:hypothetical protein